MDRLTKTQRSYNMSRIGSKNTKPELKLFSLLRRSKLRFTKHHPKLPGKPDIVFSRYKVAVFIDGEFWHGRNFSQWKNKLSDFWYNKISNNIRRDRKNTRLLKREGWFVIHVWDKTIMKNPRNTARRIIRLVDSMKLLLTRLH